MAGWIPLAISTNTAQAIAFIARTSGLDASHTNAYYALINGLVNDGVFFKLDALYLFVTADTATANLNLVSSSFNLTKTGTVTFTANSGYASTGAGNYLSTGFNPTTAPSPKYLLNTAHISVWNGGLSVSGALVGEFGGTGNIQLLTNFGGNTYFRVNDGTATNTPNGGSGFYLGNRTGASAWQGYFNGSTLGTGGSDAAVGPDNDTITFPDNASGPSDLMRAASFGGALTSGDISNLYSRISTFITTIHGSVP